MDIAKRVMHRLEYLKGFGVLAQFTDFKFIQKISTISLQILVVILAR